MTGFPVTDGTVSTSGRLLVVLFVCSDVDGKVDELPDVVFIVIKNTLDVCRGKLGVVGLIGAFVVLFSREDKDTRVALAVLGTNVTGSMVVTASVS